MGAPVEIGRKVEPCYDDDKPKQRVAQSEDPGWRIVEKDALQPMLDEAPAVGRGTRLGAKPHFKGCERACGTDPGLNHHYRNGSQMCKPKPRCIHPIPGAQIANDDADQPADNEHDDGDVQCEHQIGEKLVWHGSFTPDA